MLHRATSHDLKVGRAVHKQKESNDHHSKATSETTAKATAVQKIKVSAIVSIVDFEGLLVF